MTLAVRKRKPERVLIKMDESRPRGGRAHRLAPAMQQTKRGARVSTPELKASGEAYADPGIHFSLLQRNQLEARSARATPRRRASWVAIDTVTQT